MSEKIVNIKQYLTSYRDFRELLVDHADVIAQCREGILVLFNEKGEMMKKQVCTRSQMAFAAADLLAESAKD